MGTIFKSSGFLNALYYYFLVGIIYSFARGLWEYYSEEKMDLIIGSIIMGLIFSFISPFWRKKINQIKLGHNPPHR